MPIVPFSQYDYPMARYITLLGLLVDLSSSPQVFPGQLYTSYLVESHFTANTKASDIRMRSKTTSVMKKSGPQTPERASKYQLIGSSTPRPRITYGKHSRNRSSPNSPSRYQSLPVVSTSTTLMQSLALDYEEPIVIPDSPPLMNAPSLSIPKDTSFASALGFEKIGLSTNTQIDRQNEIDDNESKIYPQSSSTRSTRASTREAKLKDALARTEENLKVALQDAQDAKNEIEALKKAEEVRNECPCCAQVMFQPFM
ncbi:hypothetical protein F5051DRAFT_447816 [Lentinula edodes]|nr:hypothetical protein F5051DRAFT_447816 [Lentinula edodes]